VERFVQVHPARKHDLFLIPNGTIHCSGIDNLVLEISATPYIFTFKMYDWMRLDLDGKPRPLNIDRAFENLYFDRKGAACRRVHRQTARAGARPGWELIHQPTHRTTSTTCIATSSMRQRRRAQPATPAMCMSLVEGSAVLLETANGRAPALPLRRDLCRAGCGGVHTADQRGRQRDPRRQGLRQAARRSGSKGWWRSHGAYFSGHRRRRHQNACRHL
jgi:hypothetical protein